MLSLAVGFKFSFEKIFANFVITGKNTDHRVASSKVHVHCTMSGSGEVWQYIGRKVASSRWDKNQESHCSVKVDMFNDNRRVITKDIVTVRGTSSTISTATNKMYYLCTAELMQLVPIRFMVKMDNKRLTRKQINILDKLDHGDDDMFKLLYCLKAACIRNNIEKVDDHIIQTFVSMLNFKHIPMEQQEANRMIGKIKGSLVDFTDNLCYLNDMLISFNLNNPVVVTLHFTINKIDLGSPVINGSKCALQTVLGLDQESMFKELSKHDQYDPEYGQNVFDNGWTEKCKNLQNKYMLGLKKLQIALMGDYNLYNEGDDEDEDIPIFLYGLVETAKAKHEREKTKGIFCNVCGKKNSNDLWLYCHHHGFVHNTCNPYAACCCPWC